MKIYFILIFAIAFISCKRNDSKENYSKAAILDSTCVTNYSRAYADSLILINTKDFQTRFGINDPCYLDFLDSLMVQSIIYQNEKDFILLDSLCRVSDGYVGEAFASIGTTLFDKCYDKVLDYSEKYYSQDVSKSPLAQLIMESLEYNKGYYDTYLDKELTYDYMLEKLDYYYSIETHSQSRKIIKNLQKQVESGFK